MPARIRHPVRWLALLLLPVLAFFVLAGFNGATAAQIRLDTGDLRFLYFGIPLVYRWQPEPARSQLLGIAARSKVLRPDWHSCPIQDHDNFVCEMLASFYRKAADWTSADPEVARILAESIASYIKLTGARHGLPDGAYLLSGFEHDASGKPIINSTCGADPNILDYLKSQGYVPPATEPSAR